jgi:3-hydroxy-3-methylglutaryl CoA synthase
MNTVTSYNFLLALFNATTWANVLQNAASPLTNFYLAFHTADPGISGNQTTSEASYTNYARTAISRSNPAFTVTQNSGTSSTVSLGTAVSTPMSGGAGSNITFFSIGTLVSGAGQILFSGTVTPAITIATNVTPQLQAGTIITET